MRKDNTIAGEDLLKRFMDAVANKDIAALKKIKEEISRDKWLAQWGGKSIPPEAWLEPNPFVQFK